MHVFEIGFLLRLVEAMPDGDIERAAYFLHHGEGELASFAGFLHLLVVELLRGALDELVIREFPFRHEFIDWLRAVFAGFFHTVCLAGRLGKSKVESVKRP